MTPVHIIAEAGTTHEGDVKTACQMVEIAKQAGADSVKFQFINPPGLYLEKIREKGELVENPVLAPRYAQMLTEAEWRQVSDTAKREGLPFSASIFDEVSLNQLLALDPPYIKLASTDANNLPLIERVCDTGKPILLSTGMSGLGEIESAVDTLVRRGATDTVLMHCVSAYPCPEEIANVGFVSTLMAAFGLPGGFSDHTETSVSAIAAVALGATWIEKHMTQDRSAKGFDHAYAMEPDMLAGFIRDVRAAEAVLTPQTPKLGETERTVKARARRGLWAKRDLEAGHVLTADDILVVRPAGPLGPMDLDKVIGRRLAAPIGESEAIRPERLEP